MEPNYVVLRYILSHFVCLSSVQKYMMVNIGGNHVTFNPTYGQMLNYLKYFLYCLIKNHSFCVALKAEMVATDQKEKMVPATHINVGPNMKTPS